MKLNTKVRYGLRAMIEIAKHREDEGVLQKDIAVNQEISLKYLDYIVSSLKVSGLIVGFKGKGSGYVLTRKASEITVYDVYRSFEPELAIVDCSCETFSCKKTNECPTRDYWFQLNKNIKNEMMQATLAEIVVSNKQTSY